MVKVNPPPSPYKFPDEVSIKVARVYSIGDVIINVDHLPTLISFRDNIFKGVYDSIRCEEELNFYSYMSKTMFSRQWRR